MESLSLVLMEAWLEGTPAVVARESEVMPTTCADSGGGLTFASYEEYRDAVDRLLDDPAEARAMGARGREYVLDVYGWPAVSARFADRRRAAGAVTAVNQVIAAAAPGDAVTDQALAWQRLLEGWGAPRPDRGRARRPGARRARPAPRRRRGRAPARRTRLVLHYSVWSATIDAALRRAGPAGRLLPQRHAGRPAARRRTPSWPTRATAARASLPRLRGRVPPP